MAGDDGQLERKMTLYKLVVLGDKGVGKTALITRVRLIHAILELIGG